ncbi:MAG: hypothetical protein AVDCRST_MAG59-3172 [uncultured Thermomicrobiales bacterium]|jgi:hypothetical protein|uniref:Lipoprotein n=1 Tax=uncultured Thermomicrobiales bacterium TaxID=1645740 RepID=A0A6J4V5I7_9BACT|nr:MAG: hypothetical protein AVDCRST_MAG59-3172 [uncultured Thermomicrobiales bacterium]
MNTATVIAAMGVVVFTPTAVACSNYQGQTNAVRPPKNVIAHSCQSRTRASDAEREMQWAK